MQSRLTKPQRYLKALMKETLSRPASELHLPAVVLVLFYSKPSPATMETVCSTKDAAKYLSQFLKERDARGATLAIIPNKKELKAYLHHLQIRQERP